MNKFVLLAIAVLPSAVLAQERVASELVPSITVTGTGEVTASPDLARLQVGVVTEAETAAAALEQNSAAMQKLIEILKKHGLEDRDIQTTNFDVSPVYRDEQYNKGDLQQEAQQAPFEEQQKSEKDSRPRIVGYEVRNEVMITIRKLAEMGAILDAVVQSGANSISSIQFDIAEKEKLLDEARKAAVQNARRKAEIYAGADGRVVRHALLIREAEQDSSGSFLGRLELARRDVPILAGEQTLSVSVTVTYHID